ncbi:MAG: phosphate signaling complex protein PhoU [Magnetococcales bacterium]|nr:phosphate signaling complex protein PhoU [Magnetococcales bacterium]
MNKITPDHHIHHAFDQELRQLDAVVLKMCDQVTSLLQDAITAVTTGDLELASAVVKRDQEIDELEFLVKEKTVQILALREPKAVDLRWVIAALESASNLERMGDMAKNIAKRVAILTSFAPMDGIAEINRMAHMIIDFMEKIRQSWAEKNSTPALEAWNGDALVDTLFDALFKNLMVVMIHSPRNITQGTHLLFIAKNLERIGDHITNIAESIYYLETGKKIGSTRPKTDDHYRTSIPLSASSASANSASDTRNSEPVAITIPKGTSSAK